MKNKQGDVIVNEIEDDEPAFNNDIELSDLAKGLPEGSDENAYCGSCYGALPQDKNNFVVMIVILSVELMQRSIGHFMMVKILNNVKRKVMSVD